MVDRIYMGRMLAATPKIIPAVYEDAMSYYEQLRILNDKLNEVIAVFNSYGDDLLTQSMQYTDEQVSELRADVTSQLDAIQTSLQTQFVQLEAQIRADLEAQIEKFNEIANQVLADFQEKANQLNDEINQLRISVNVLFEIQGRTKLEMRQEMRREIDKLKNYVDQLMAAKLGEQIIVWNPYRKGITNLNQALSDLFQITYSMFSLTADEYRSLEITADEYKTFQLSANDYLYKARWFFLKRLYFPDIDAKFKDVYGYIDSEVAALDKNHYMISPFDGQLTPIRKIVYQLARLHMHGITTDQYRDALLTADQYKAKNITAHDYAWNGYYLIYTDATPLPTLEEQIAETQNQIAALSARVSVLENGATPSDQIKAMQDAIVKNTNDLIAYKEDQGKRDDTQESAISANASRVEAAHIRIDNLRDTYIPDEINGLNDTLTTVDQGLQKQITAMDNGLQSIHINYTATTLSRR